MMMRRMKPCLRSIETCSYSNSETALPALPFAPSTFGPFQHPADIAILPREPQLPCRSACHKFCPPLADGGQTCFGTVLAHSGNASRGRLANLTAPTSQSKPAARRSPDNDSAARQGAERVRRCPTRREQNASGFRTESPVPYARRRRSSPLLEHRASPTRSGSKRRSRRSKSLLRPFRTDRCHTRYSGSTRRHRPDRRLPAKGAIHCPEQSCSSPSARRWRATLAFGNAFSGGHASGDRTLVRAEPRSCLRPGPAGGGRGGTQAACRTPRRASVGWRGTRAHGTGGGMSRMR